MTTNTKTLTLDDLSHFAGDLERYRHPLARNVIYTPGVQHVAEAGQAYWLIDAIASYLSPTFVKKAATTDARIRGMQFWKLTVSDNNTAALRGFADSGVPPFVEQEIPFADFPLKSVDIWAAFDGTYWTLYLPSEH